MANQEHLETLKRDTAVWNKWREQHPEIRPDLSGALLIHADLSGANLIHADLSRADLSDADLSKAHLDRATLTGAKLRGANLYIADLTLAILSYADLTQANFNGANLDGAILIGAVLYQTTLTGANFNIVIMWNTILSSVDLSTIEGLTTVKHLGPSSIGIDTIYRSHGKIPESFLRDAGAPDTFVDNMHSMVGKANQYFTCFISYSHKDQRFCDRLYADLRSHDVPSWYFPEDATWGESVWREIDRGIERYDKLVVVCSQHSLQSGPVLREIERALQREDRESKYILFPLRLDNYLFEQWEHERKADVVSKVVGDFCGWDTSAEEYEKAFKRLLKALKAEEATAS